MSKTQTVVHNFGCGGWEPKVINYVERMAAMGFDVETDYKSGRGCIITATRELPDNVSIPSIDMYTLDASTK